jgi:Sugar transferases involved in lipopolysaccharide synthesis
MKTEKMKTIKTRENTIYVRYIKEFFGKLIAALLLILFWWLYAICAVMIIVETGFPVIYKQKRVGKNGILFYVYKFRTMVKNADKIGPKSTSTNDSRITKMGSILRKTSLDELPQMINIIRGDMNLVGFRPDVPRDTDDLKELKYLMKPGITGLAQVNGRSSLTIEQKKYWEEQYPQVVSFGTDLKIIGKTFRQVFLRKGTN